MLCRPPAFLAALLAACLPAQQSISDGVTSPLRAGANQSKATRVNEAIFQAIGFGNTMMVVTGEGNVVIDTSISNQAERN
jgi:hypothetical protein